MQDLFKSKITASISTCSKDGSPWASTTPYIIVEDKAYIYISKIAEHYYNLMENPAVCIMIVQDTSESKNPFVLHRATFKSNAKELQEDEVKEEVWDSFKERFSGDMLERLKAMNFSMFELPLNTGRYVTDFGKAFDVTYKLDENNKGFWEEVAVNDVKMRMK